MRHVCWLVAVMAGCGEGDSTVVDLGVIVASSRSEPPIDHPATSPANADIQVTVTTYGDDCTWVDRTDVEVTGLEAILRPFDKSAVDSVCGDILIGYPHPTTIRFERAGTATITVLGYDEGDRFGAVIQRSSAIEIQ